MNANYDAMPDGRFLMLRGESQGGQLHIVLNWTEELKADHRPRRRALTACQ